MFITIITGLITLSAVVHIRAEYMGPRVLVYIFKPLTTSLIILLALSVGSDRLPAYRVLILGGLFFSLAGDIFLMLPSDWFIAGLVSFLIAHLFYIFAFGTGRAFSPQWLSAVPFVVFGAIVYFYLYAALDGMRIPVAAYIIVILSMAWVAYDQMTVYRTAATIWAFVGALFFVLSDAILAINRFRIDFASAKALNLGTYFAAQYLIAYSIGL
jgi:uncharacterized membrane protein YhhN